MAILVAIVVVIASKRKKARKEGAAVAALAAVAYQKSAYQNPASTAPPGQVAATVGVAQAMQVVQMQCPAGCDAGSVVQSEVNGKPMQITVPAGVSEGQMFQVQVPM